MVRIYGARSAAPGSARPGDRRGRARAGAWPGAGARGAGGTPRRPGCRPTRACSSSRAPGRAARPAAARLRDEQLARVGAELGTLVGRLGHMVQPRRGHVHRPVAGPRASFRESCATSRRGSTSMPRTWSPHWSRSCAAVADDAQDLLDDERRACLVHSDLNAKNLLVDPDTLEVTGVLDWEFAHSGLPWTDLGQPAPLRAAPSPRRGRAVGVHGADAGRARRPPRPGAGGGPVRSGGPGRPARRERCRRTGREHLWAIARTGDLHAVP